MNKFRLIYILILMSTSSSILAQQYNSTFLDNEEWNWIQGNTAAAGGITWQFFKDNNFKAVHWYSGGAYWRHLYEGTYHYDPQTKTVYLKYKKNTKLPLITRNRCIQILDNNVDPNNDSVVFYDDWEKRKGVYIPLKKGKIAKEQISALPDRLSSNINLNVSSTFKRGKIPATKL
ncbi:hypothetical protein [Pedobacter punctiformis]|uniref:Uncharacterized protein n=1 Tax=Pedobacter punctiformis TaxID=3004097 RepID=A0ABT4L6N3_9SPHI|nr:hypothetical protein [Pedobacter sp. HCMS5-2]MCZ4243585.1 hypothetical protein [Pedobacter sp. HCMS5-2]